ncbi:hypothetical protein [Ferruginibacter albus]|uniref:hypothetical protein n=1 Tax=Ferruginibacter albus TaxID=2875540 RepID=UPI001CC5C2A5|nr:hypothetical protein [Ferruginibacter albus]UAY52294.1 hypothetical protein K9M53_01035 [Ferruginibacter albus]
MKKQRPLLNPATLKVEAKAISNGTINVILSNSKDNLVAFFNVKAAPGIKNKFLYFIMPPGWSHTGDHKTAKATLKKYLEEEQKTQSHYLIDSF